MKKFLLGVAMIAGVSSSVMALPTASSFQTSPTALKATAGMKGLKGLSLAPTNIVIVNLTYSLIHFSVPNSNIDEPLYPSEYNYIADYSGAYFLPINIEDSYHTIFWSQTVCPRAVIMVTSLSPSGVGVMDEHCG